MLGTGAVSLEHLCREITLQRRKAEAILGIVPQNEPNQPVAEAAYTVI